MELEKKLEYLFKELGLKKIYAKIYEAILYYGGKATPIDIMKRTGLSKTIVYKGLKELGDYGLVVELATKPKIYMVKSPHTALKELVQKRTMSILYMIDKVSKEIDTYLQNTKWRKEPIYSIISGKRNIINTIHLMLKSAKNEISFLLPAELIGEFIKDLENARDRDVYIDVVVFNTIGPYDEFLSRLSNYATVVRTRLHEARVFIITDNEAALITQYIDGVFGIHASLIEDEEVVHVLNNYYYNRIAASSVITEININPGDQYTFKNTVSALKFIVSALERKFNLYIKVKGYDVVTYDDVEVEGYLVNVFFKPHKGIFSLLIDSGGIFYSIGGYRAFLEDISAREITVIVKNDFIELKT